MKTPNNWRLRYWKVPHLENLELLHAANITYQYPTHVHEEHSIGLMLRGTEVTTCRGASYTAIPGRVVLINADEVHSSKSNKTEYRIIKVRPTVLKQIALELVGHDPEGLCFPKLVINDRLVYRQLLDLHLRLEQNGSALEQESDFITSIGLLLTRHTKGRFVPQPSGKEPYYVKLTQDYLRSHYAENVSLARLTSITNLSSFHLLRVFSQQVGCPPHQYQTQLRITHARKLMRKGSSIAEVAQETGFCDQSHFSRTFKRIVGVTPGRYFARSKIVQDATDQIRYKHPEV
jgi:AraC-like DNA-binding protein